MLSFHLRNNNYICHTDSFLFYHMEQIEEFAKNKKERKAKQNKSNNKRKVCLFVFSFFPVSYLPECLNFANLTQF